MDENRLFANTTKYVSNMGALVKRDRNHPSVVIWSFCNENGCEGTREKGGPRFQEITKEFDGTRPTLGNMFTFNDLLSTPSPCALATSSTSDLNVSSPRGAWRLLLVLAMELMRFSFPLDRSSLER